MRNRIWMVVAMAGLIAGCSDGVIAPVTGGGPGGTGTGTLALSAADMSGVTPCPTQAILMDAGELALLKAALKNGTVVHLDVPFNGADPDIFKKKCGREGFWNPAAAVNEIPPITTPVTIASLFQVENLGICAAGFDVNSFGTGEGFPAAGTYRKEFKVAHMGMTYHVRTRITVSGTSAGVTFASAGIAVPDDIENTVVYEVDGVVYPHADLIARGIDALAASTTDAPSYRLDVRLSAPGAIVFTAVVELICVSKV